MGEFGYDTPPSGEPSPGQGSQPPQAFQPRAFEPQSFEPQGFEPQGFAPGAVAEETFDRVPYPPAYGSPAQPAPAVQSHMPAVLPQAPWDMPAPRVYSATHVAPVYWSPASTERNWMGVTSIVLACLGGGLLGAIFGWKGIAAAREGRATNGRMAQWGLILNMAVPLVALAVVFSVRGPGVVGGSGQSPWATVAVGECFAPSEGKSDDLNVRAPKRVECAGEHWSQVYFTGTVAGGAQPGDAALTQQVKEMCVSREALARLNPARLVELYPTVIVPDKESWAANERWVVCLVSDVDGSITGSWLRGA